MLPQPSLPESRSRGFRHSSSYGHTVLCPNRKTYSSLRLLSLLPPGIFLLCGRRLRRPCRASGLTAPELRTIIMQKFRNERAGFMKENRKLLKEVLKDIQHDMTDEEVLNLLADSKISESPTAEKYTLGQRAADAIAKFAGSWAFIFSFTGVLLLWMVVNTILAADAFDPFPFILLNLVLSCVAAIQAPLIMMSQNRQEEKDRRRAENDYKVNLKTEIMIEDLYDKVNAILAKQSALEKKLQEQEETKS